VRELEGQLQAKELEHSQVAAEGEWLEKALTDQATQHAEEVRQLKEGEELLKAEFESQRSDWSDREKYPMEGYEVIEDMLEGKSSFSFGWLPAVAGSRLLILLCSFKQSTFRTPPVPSTRRSRRDASSGGRQAWRSSQASPRTWANSTGPFSFVLRRCAGCSAGFSVPRHRSWRGSDWACGSPRLPVGLPTGWRWWPSGLTPGRAPRHGPAPRCH
jgi:hypothetical protein